MRSSIYSGPLGQLYGDMARSDKILERPIEYSDEPTTVPEIVFKQPKQKKPPKKPYERIQQEVTYHQQLKNAALKEKLASGEVVRAKRWSTGSNWGQAKRVRSSSRFFVFK